MGAFTSARPACGIYADTVLLRYLKAQGVVLLCGGLVGPIFLAVYFLFGTDPLLKWMFWWGLLVTGADVLIALAMANYGARSAASRTMPTITAPTANTPAAIQNATV